MRISKFLVAFLFLGGSALADAAPKHVLLVTHAGGYMHDSILTAEQVLRELGPKNGYELTCYRFTADPDKKITVKRRAPNSTAMLVLVYDIRKPEGFLATGHLATDVAEALKRRVDPNDVYHISWRPQGDEKLEIDLPLSPQAEKRGEEYRQLRRQMTVAAAALEKTNVSIEKVIRALESRDPHSTDDLNSLAGDSKTRQKMFADLKDLWNRKEQAKADGDAKNWSRLEHEYRAKLHPHDDGGIEIPSAIVQTNLSPETLDGELAATEAPATSSPRDRAAAERGRKELLESLHARFDGSPKQFAVIEAYIRAADQLYAANAAPDEMVVLKRLLKGAGILEFHIMAHDIMPPADYAEYVRQLRTDGPRIHAGDEAKWFEVDPTRRSGLRFESHDRKLYVLAYSTPSSDGKPRSLDAHAAKPWHLTNASAMTQPQSGERVVGFTFDRQAAIYFGELTEANIRRPLAIVLDDEIISAPVINSKITRAGQITGGRNGFTPEEQDYLVNTLSAGSLPAALSPEPVSERIVAPQVDVEVTALEDYSYRYQKLMGEPVTREQCGRVNAETLKKFDAVIFFTTSTWNPKTGSHPLTPEELHDLIEWVNNGGAFVAVHCGSDTLHDTAYGDLVGATFGGHPWLQTVRIHVEDPNHPAGKPFTDGAEIMDEIYQFGKISDRPKVPPMSIQPYSREKLHIITSIDPTSIDLNLGARPDHDYASSWCHNVGKGRSFYTALGHQKAVWLDPRFQQHLLGGLKWVLRELPGDATPSTQIKK